MQTNFDSITANLTQFIPELDNFCTFNRTRSINAGGFSFVFARMFAAWKPSEYGKKKSQLLAEKTEEKTRNK